jgi:hypothetical protein
MLTGFPRDKRQSAAINMWIGVNRAGYSYADEFPIFLLIFAAPAALAAGLWWAGTDQQARRTRRPKEKKERTT